MSPVGAGGRPDGEEAKGAPLGKKGAPQTPYRQRTAARITTESPGLWPKGGKKQEQEKEFIPSDCMAAGIETIRLKPGIL